MSMAEPSQKQTEFYGIKIDYERDKLFDELGKRRLRESYMTEEEISPQERFAFVSKSFSSNPEHAQRLYEYSSKHWLSYSTPILAFGRTKRGLPISCYLNWMDDSSSGLVDTLSETNWLSMLGGGVGIGLGIRSADDKSVGIMPHLKIYDASSLAFRQGRTRRGSYAVYLDISHPDILQFIEMRKPTGDPNVRCQNLHHGINITDDFMQIIERCMEDPNADDTWELIDPNTKEVKEKVSARNLWQRIIETRMFTGEPYILFIDTANKAFPEYLKLQGQSVKHSNLCSEILENTDKDMTAICCLASLNLEYYDEWKDDPIFIQDVAEMLDNVLTYFIENAPDTIPRAKYSAMRQRNIGIGVLGFHAYLQKKNVPFESAMAKSVNLRLFKHIKKFVDLANLRLGTERGEAPDALESGKRFCLSQAIAPTASTSIILGNTSPSIEPWRANAYRQDTLSGAYLNRNKFLDRIIKDRCKDNSNKLNYDEIWSSIIANDGSVQHLDFLDDYTKDVYKTAVELNQQWIIEHASDRQEFIDQGQSVNLFFRPDSNIKYIHAAHFLAWKRGLKTLYYCRSSKMGKSDKISKQIERQIIEEIDMQSLIDEEQCLACQ